MPNVELADDARPEETETLDSEQEYNDAFDQFASGEVDEPEEDPEDEPDDPDEASDEPEDEPDEPAEEPAPEGETPDPWAQAPEDLKAERERLVAERDAALQAARSDAGRQAALQRQVEELRKKANGTGPTASQLAAALKDPEKFEQAAQDFPELADGMRELVKTYTERTKQELTGVFNQRLQSLESEYERVKQQREADFIASQMQALDEKHPDWRQIKEDNSFHSWVQTQPPGIQTLLNSDDANEASVVLSLYKAAHAPAHQPPPPPQASHKRERLKQAATPSGINKAAVRRQDVPDEFDAAFDHFARKRSG